MSRTIIRSIIFVVLVTTIVTANSQSKAHKKTWVEKLGENDWDRMLTGEWMVEFYAPWCPACKNLQPIWENFAMQMNEIGVNVGKIDVTEAPGLSGRFMVTALPTIYHVKDGIFRQYKSPRDRDSLVEFVSQKTWMKVDPISSWKSPTSIQMSIISQFFRISQILRGIHNKLMEDFGVPTWGTYLIFALATIVLGAVLGLLIVCIIDFIYPPKVSTYQGKKKLKDDSSGFAKNSTDDELVDAVKDDLVDEEGSEESEDKSENDKTDKESKSQTSSPNVRKRRSRKAD